MSYILDALNKAERERGIKHTPASLVRHESQAGPGRRRWIIAGALVACAAAAIWFLLPSLSTVSQTPGPAGPGAGQDLAAGRADIERAGDSTPPNAASSPTPPPELPPRAKPGLSNDALISPQSMTSTFATAASAPEVQSAQRENGMESSAGGVHLPSQATQAKTLPQQILQEPDAPSSAEEASPQALPNTITASQATREVTSTPRGDQGKAMSLREAVDKMTMSILMYAEAKAERRVYINGRKYVEGDYVDGRYLVESITLEGVVLSYEGERALLRSGSK